MAFEAHGPSLHGVDFEVEKRVDTPENLIAATKRGAAWVWHRTAHQPTRMRVIFCDRITNEDGTLSDASGMYSPSEDFMAVAVDKISEGVDQSPGLDQRMGVLVGGHEAAHRRQFHRGERPRPSRELIAEGLYEDDPHELEAWDESLQALKLLYPDEGHTFRVGIRTHTTPPRSRYDTRTSGARSREGLPERSGLEKQSFRSREHFSIAPPKSLVAHTNSSGIIPINNTLWTPKIEQAVVKLPRSIR